MPEQIIEFIIGDALIVVPALWIIGTFLKNTPKVADWSIPWYLALFGILGTVSILGFSPQAVIQGILVAGAAVLVHQLKVQTQYRKEK